jgi:hypothetical protein
VTEKNVKNLPLSISTGTCQANGKESVPLLITRADQLLYKSKRQKSGSVHFDKARIGTQSVTQEGMRQH